MKKNEQAVRQLIAKSISFDGYNLSGCETIRDRPFFGDSVYQIGKYTLSVRTQSFGELTSLEFESVCKIGRICFQPYVLTFEEFVKKLNNAANTGSDFIYFEISPVIDWRISCNNCSYRSNDCERLIKDKPKTVMAAVSFDIDDIRRALAEYHGIVTNINGGLKMKKNNFFGMNFEFGMSKDRNLAATLFGVAVRDGYGGSWYTYDSVKNERTNLANVKFGDFPIFLLPVNTMNPGDLMKIEGKYYWIKAVTPEGTVRAVNALDGRIEEILPTKSLIPGFNLYTKVVAMDTKSLTDPSGNNVANNLLSAMLLMQWSKNDGKKAEFSLDDIDDNSFNGIGAMWPLILAQGGNNNLSNLFGGDGGQIDLPMLMMLGAGDSTDESGFMQIYVLSQLMNGGGNTGLERIIPGLGNTPQQNVTGNDAVVCDKCGSTYPAGTNFCPKCGVKTHPMGQFCKNCGAQLMPGAAFCHKCGTKVGPAVCPKCGHEAPEDAAFCPKCGTNLKEQVTTVAPTTPVAPVTPVVPTVPATPVTTEAAEEKK